VSPLLINPEAPATSPAQAATPAAPLSTPSTQSAITAPTPDGVAREAQSLLLRLRTRDAIREAIILREILGPPKAIEPENRGLFALRQ
jgi:hypothetical protein